MNSYYRLSNGNFIGCTVLKVSEFASVQNSGSIESINGAKKRLINEFYRLSYPYQVCIELLLITEQAEKQVFRSNVGVYIVVRAMDSSNERVSLLLNNATKCIKSNLEECGYTIDNYKSDYSPINNDSYLYTNGLYAVTKAESSSTSITSKEIHYFSQVIDEDIDFSSLLSRLSEMCNCVVSFQLFPFTFDAKETSVISAYLGRLEQYLSGYILRNQIVRDSSAKDPYDYFNYYKQHMSSPLFTYNIIISSPVDSCGILVNTVLSLMQGTNNKSFSSITLPALKYDLQKQFLFYPWNLNNYLIYNVHNQNLLKASFVSKALFKIPYIVTSAEASLFFRPPVFEEAPSMLVESKDSKQTAPLDTLVTNEGNILLGKIQTSYGEEIGIGASADDFTRHAVVVGMSGYGKTTYMIHLLLQFYKKGIPFLVIEPTKTEYRALIDEVSELQIFTPGNSKVSPFILNPFIPPKGIILEQYKSGLFTAFEAAFSLETPLTEIFTQAINDVYTEHNWKGSSMQGDPEVLPFGFHEFILTFKRIVRKSHYRGENKSNLETAGTFRLIKLIEQNSSLYDVINTVPIEDIISKPTIIELNSINNQEQKALLISILLNSICLYTKNNVGDGHLKNVMMIDEAHVLLDPTASGNRVSSSQITIKAIQNMIMEIRSFGTGIIIADQRPSQIGKDIIGNTEIKTSFKLIEPEERQMIANTMNMDEVTVDELSNLSVGEAFVYYNMLAYPQMITNRDIRKEKGIRLSVSNDEVVEKMHYWDDKQQLLKPYGECKLCKWCAICDKQLSDEAAFIGSKYRIVHNDDIKDKDSFQTLIYNIDHYDELQKICNFKNEPLIICSAIRFTREILRNTEIEFQKKDIELAIKKLAEKIEER